MKILFELFPINEEDFKEEDRIVACNTYNGLERRRIYKDENEFDFLQGYISPKYHRINKYGIKEFYVTSGGYDDGYFTHYLKIVKDDN